MLLNVTNGVRAAPRSHARKSSPASASLLPARRQRLGTPHARVVGLKSRTQLQVSATATAPLPASAPSLPTPAPAAVPPATLPAPRIVEAVIAAAVAKSAYTWQKTLMLSFTAGAQIALGGLLMIMVAGGCGPLAAQNPGLQRILAGVIGLPTGLSLVVLTGGELFTGNTFVMTTGWLEKKVTGSALLKNWIVSFIGNFLGALFIVALAHLARTTTATPWLGASIAIATAKVSFPFVSAFVKGILCNWLVCSSVWIAIASHSTAGKMLGVLLPVSMFVALGFEHSVANMFLIPQGMLNGASVSVSQFLLGNLLPVTLGNIVGGAVLMGYANWYVHRSPVNSRA